MELIIIILWSKSKGEEDLFLKSFCIFLIDYFLIFNIRYILIPIRGLPDRWMHLNYIDSHCKPRFYLTSAQARHNPHLCFGASHQSNWRRSCNVVSYFLPHFSNSGTSQNHFVRMFSLQAISYNQEVILEEPLFRNTLPIEGIFFYMQFLNDPINSCIQMPL